MKITDIYQRYAKHYLVDTDTRNIRKNTLFFALKGDHFNGNAFAAQALALGASYAVIDDASYQKNEQYILVPDVLTCLQELANYHRKQLNIPIIALTGSNGKTTTKELIHAVLRQKFNTTATRGNLNNHIGVPLTLLAMNEETELGIVEMGANHQKEIEFLSGICEPDFGYITNFGKAHLEGFGGLAGVIKGKSELYTYLKNHGKTAFVNNNDPLQLAKTAEFQRVLFTDDLQFLDANPKVRLRVNDVTIDTHLIGAYNYSNIAAAISIGRYFNIAIEKIKEAIIHYVPNNNRSQVVTTASNTIILDAYNANPSSMKVALESFGAMKAAHKTIILGDMFELGERSLEEHQAIAALADSLHVDQVCFVGAHFYQTQTDSVKLPDFDALKDWITTHPIHKSTVLIKGSRGMQLERVLALIN